MRCGVGEKKDALEKVKNKWDKVWVRKKDGLEKIMVNCDRVWMRKKMGWKKWNKRGGEGEQKDGVEIVRSNMIWWELEQRRVGKS